ncbi:hypothetical protein B4N84_10740 [Flavobacterium sp. IR1]|nr:hypothetical protein B4N84_10740 [Flavobacterium sp. IR1]
MFLHSYFQKKIIIKKNNVILKSKKDLLLFIDNSDLNITYLINKLNKKGLVGTSFDDYIDKIDAIEKYYEDEFLNETIDEQQKLRLAFWSFFAKLLIRELGGELQIAPKNDYSEGTPQLINYGNRFDKKGKRKWIGISFNSWLESHISKKNLVSLKGKVNKLIEDYS